MENATPLPPYLVDRYRDWSRSNFADFSELYGHLAAEGQEPGAMVIACCDSRVSVEPLFAPAPGEAFIHRNIANLVPRHNIHGDKPGTAAAVEYAVTVLKVRHLIVMGHSGCGGVAGCNDMCEGNAPGLSDPSSYVGRWIEELRPAHARVAEIEDRAERLTAMEKAGVCLSLENLAEYPFVATAMEAGNLELHGLWIDIGVGRVECYDSTTDAFAPL